MLLVRLVTLPVRLGWKTGKVATKVSYRTARFAGAKRMIVLGIGIGIGLLIAPGPGRALRDKLRGLVSSPGQPSGPELSDRVRFELSHSPKTWHLPQPGIDVRDDTVVLSGSVPHETARADLEQAAVEVAGVARVENLLVVSGANGQG